MNEQCWGIWCLRTRGWMYEDGSHTDDWTTTNKSEAMRDWREMGSSKFHEVRPYPEGATSDEPERSGEGVGGEMPKPVKGKRKPASKAGLRRSGNGKRKGEHPKAPQGAKRAAVKGGDRAKPPAAPHREPPAPDGDVSAVEFAGYARPKRARTRAVAAGGVDAAEIIGP